MLICVSSSVLPGYSPHSTMSLMTQLLDAFGPRISCGARGMGGRGMSIYDKKQGLLLAYFFVAHCVPILAMQGGESTTYSTNTEDSNGISENNGNNRNENIKDTTEHKNGYVSKYFATLCFIYRECCTPQIWSNILLSLCIITNTLHRHNTYFQPATKSSLYIYQNTRL